MPMEHSGMLGTNELIENKSDWRAFQSLKLIPTEPACRLNTGPIFSPFWPIFVFLEWVAKCAAGSCFEW